jgi:hypothetical protein
MDPIEPLLSMINIQPGMRQETAASRLQVNIMNKLAKSKGKQLST